MYTNSSSNEVIFWVAFESMDETALGKHFSALASSLKVKTHELPGSRNFQYLFDGTRGRGTRRIECFAILDGSRVGLDRCDAIVLLDTDERRRETEATLRRLLAEEGQGPDVPILFSKIGQSMRPTFDALAALIRDGYASGRWVERNPSLAKPA